MGAGMITFWLWFGARCLTAVRMPIGTSNRAVVARAIERHRAVPLCYPEPPYQFEAYLNMADVRTYAGEM